MNLNLVQILALVLIVLGAITGGTAQLTDLFGPTATKVLVSASSLLTSIISGFVTVLTGQANQIRSVQDMPGVERIVVNEKANPTLASMAVDPANAKIVPTPQSAEVVQQTAKTGDTQ